MKEKPYFIYPAVLKEKSFITPKLDVVNYTSFPLDVVVLSSGTTINARKIYLIDRSPYSQMISLDNHRNDSCCGRKTVLSFYALNVSKPGENIRISIPVHGNQPLKIGLQRHLMKIAEIDESEL